MSAVEQTTKDSPYLKLMLGATGVVFGDIGTSPLYAFRDSFVGEHRLPVDSFHVLGVLSMLVWALTLVVTLKYVAVTMRADNAGEGGSLALLALIKRVKPKSRAIPYVAWAALIATALFYGDAVITPAISILSAVEGLTLLDKTFADFVIPLTLVIVVALFAVQRFGTGFVGQFFGPIMVVWFVTIGVLGVIKIVENPEVLSALNPMYALRFVFDDPVRAFFTLGTVVLAVTGAEALYADMGHFGRPAIPRAWLYLAFPALLLCYAGQAALVLKRPDAIEQAFYLMIPSAYLVPLLILATLATIIASQSILSGAFSVTHQAVRLGYLPHLRFKHTSEESRGQVYSGAINAILFVAVVGLVLGFKSSANLAAAFGLAVTATMVLTTLMMGFVIFRVWEWNPIWAGPLYGLMLAIDAALFAASTTKFADGAWFPVLVATVLAFVFVTWKRGRTLIEQRLAKDTVSVANFLPSADRVTRVPAVAVYLTSDKTGVPVSLLHNLKCNHVLHEHVLLLTIETALVPYVPRAERLTVTDEGHGILRVLVRYGFAQPPNVPAALALLKPDYPWFDPGKATYVLNRLTIVPSSKRPGMARLRTRLFSALAQIAESPMRFLQLPVSRVIELGSQVEI